MWPANTAFSPQLPTLQLYWDSVSLGALKLCPRYYELAIVRGWRSRQQAVDLDFGIFLHSARERYYHGLASGAGHYQAQRGGLDWLLTATWNGELNRPWQGDQYKNRFTLARSFIWYTEQWGERDPLEQVMLANGKPAVEVSFRFDLGETSRETGEAFSLCGHLDRMVRFNGGLWGSDLKSTKHSLDASYFQQFSPDNQMSLYSLAMGVVMAEPARGIIIDAVQVGVGFSRFTRGLVQRSEQQLEEWLRGLKVLLAQAEGYARDNFWPQNDRACFRCQFRSICSKSPSVREAWLKADFVQKIWDPTVTRGDI
jgi:PD-(D/E)XK nuclease superfamily